MRLILALTGLLALLLAVTGPVRADEAELRAVIAKFAEAKKFKQTEAVIDEIAAVGDPAAAPALNALSEGLLMVRESDGAVFVIRGRTRRSNCSIP
jgi:urea transport system permease protein